MSSTSSAERPSQKHSATEILASRYRHLFVLPSTWLLLVYAAGGSLLLGVLSRGGGGALPSAVALAVFALSAAAASSALKIADSATIANYRRTLAAILAGEVLWLIVAGCGAVYSWVVGGPGALTNAYLFGALTAGSVEFLIFNGAFTDNAFLAIVLSAIHPTATLVALRFSELSAHFDPAAIAASILAFVVIAGFTNLLERRKTNLGHDALSLFRSFMKTWVAGESSQLEAIISDHSEETDVESSVLRFRTRTGDLFIILPGVHPGPFHPIGSYDLPGAISRAFNDLGPVMTFHRPGGHERNLATKKDTLRFATELRTFAESIVPSTARASVRGPLEGHVGKATVSMAAFADDLLMTISFAPFGSDDLETKVEEELARRASAQGLILGIIDAHNSIGESQEMPDLTDPGWADLMSKTGGLKPAECKVAYAHSNEVKFLGRGDLTENGVGLLMIETDRKYVLVLADANNAVPTLRAESAKALLSMGYNILEFCTSDSHNLAARGLTVARGYEALGEQTPVPAIASMVAELAHVADGRLAPATYGSGRLKSRVRVFGAKALEQFATITQESSGFAMRYLKFAIVSVGALLVLSLLL